MDQISLYFFSWKFENASSVYLCEVFCLKSSPPGSTVIMHYIPCDGLTQHSNDFMAQSWTGIEAGVMRPSQNDWKHDKLSGIGMGGAQGAAAPPRFFRAEFPCLRAGTPLYKARFWSAPPHCETSSYATEAII